MRQADWKPDRQRRTLIMKIKAGTEVEYEEYVQKNQGDGYSKAVIDYSVAWANLMEERISHGASIQEMAQETSHLADTKGITGFMYGCAVWGLSKYWEHGEELRKWHNIKTQIGNEGEKANETGGVLNPALINLATKD